jgi:hypothetical protein
VIVYFSGMVTVLTPDTARTVPTSHAADASPNVSVVYA